MLWSVHRQTEDESVPLLEEPLVVNLRKTRERRMTLTENATFIKEQMDHQVSDVASNSKKITRSRAIQSDEVDGHTTQKQRSAVKRKRGGPRKCCSIPKNVGQIKDVVVPKKDEPGPSSHQSDEVDGHTTPKQRSAVKRKRGGPRKCCSMDFPKNVGQTKDVVVPKKKKPGPSSQQPMVINLRKKRGNRDNVAENKRKTFTIKQKQMQRQGRKTKKTTPIEAIQSGSGVDPQENTPKQRIAVKRKRGGPRKCCGLDSKKDDLTEGAEMKDVAPDDDELSPAI